MIPAIHPHAVQTLTAIMANVLVLLSTWAIPMKDVDQNVFSVRIVAETGLVYATNVAIHVQERVVRMPNAKWSITFPSAPVQLDTQVIHSVTVVLLKLCQNRNVIHAIPHLADQTVNVVKLAIKLYVPVCRALSELHHSVDLSVSSAVNALKLRPVSIRNVLIHVEVLVESMPGVRLSITVRSAVVVPDKLVIHSIAVSQYHHHRLPKKNLYLMIPAILPLVVPIQFVEPMLAEIHLVNVSVGMLELLQIVVQNVSSTQTVPVTKPASITNVSIRVLDRAEQMPNVVLYLMLLFAPVLLDTQEIHLCSV